MNTVISGSTEDFINLVRQLNLSISSPRDMLNSSSTEVHCRINGSSGTLVDRTFYLCDLYFYLRSVELHVYDYLSRGNYSYDKVPDCWDYDRLVRIIDDVESMDLGDEQVVITRDEWNPRLDRYTECVVFDTFMMNKSKECKYRLAGVLYTAGLNYGNPESVSIYSKWDFVRKNDNSFEDFIKHDEFVSRFGSDWQCIYGYGKNQPREMDRYLLGQDDYYRL